MFIKDVVQKLSEALPFKIAKQNEMYFFRNLINNFLPFHSTYMRVILFFEIHFMLISKILVTHILTESISFFKEKIPKNIFICIYIYVCITKMKSQI